MKENLIGNFGTADSAIITQGIDHVSSLWYSSDGTPKEFEEFCYKQIIPSGPELDSALRILEQKFEIMQGHTHEIY